MTTIYSQRSDRDLVLACQRREPAAFEELVKRHQKNVYALLFHLAPDWSDTAQLAQEVFIRVWRSINNLRNPALFRNWLIQITTNLFYEEYRNRPRRLDLKTIDLDRSGECTQTAFGQSDEESRVASDENELNEDVSSCLRRAMSQLPEQFRTSLVLRELEGLNYDEIAAVTKTELGTVKSRISEARTKLWRALAPAINKAYKPEVAI